jgi:hypothetical protein
MGLAQLLEISGNCQFQGKHLVESDLGLIYLSGDSDVVLGNNCGDGSDKYG